MPATDNETPAHVGVRFRFEERLERLARTLGIAEEEQNRPVLLVCCGRRKLVRTSRADEMYVSPRSRLASQLARGLGSPFWIVSSKHALLKPDAIIAPYDVALDKLDPFALQEWKRRLREGLQAAYPHFHSRFVILGGGAYVDRVREVLDEIGWPSEAPLAGLPIDLQLSWLKKANRAVRRASDIRHVYRELESLVHRGGLLPLDQALAQAGLPGKGVYIFLDPTEPSQLAPGSARIVRVGTHAVSEGSKATLRNRLRTHKGTGSGQGNHRSSIFRLHVGAALMRKFPQHRRVSSWGVSKSYTQEILAEERALEEAVSRYIGRLQVAIVPIEDAATKFSLRRYVEKNLIAMLTEDHVILDRPSPEWLGNYSPNATIRDAGLWNISQVYSSYDPTSLSLVKWG